MGETLYNKLVFLPIKKNHEKLYLKKNIYDLILVLDFNRKPTTTYCDKTTTPTYCDKNPLPTLNFRKLLLIL